MAIRVLMLGWEYPPHISGGLGTACEGLSSALSRQNAEILFVVPHLGGDENAPHMTLLDSNGKDASVVEGEFFRAEGGGVWSEGRRRTGWSKVSSPSTSSVGSGSTRMFKVPAALKPYWNEADFDSFKSKLIDEANRVARGALEIPADDIAEAPTFVHYGRDIFEEVERYALRIVSLFSEEQFDVIHAHDWMTFPAAVALAQVTGRPLVVHVHSLEFDRSGVAVNPRIAELERWGMEAADAVIAVSYYTRSLIQREYEISIDKIHVVHNGIYPKELIKTYQSTETRPRRTVLFLGRITFQKGPDYFVEAAAKVVPLVPDVLFVLAGSGDMLERMVHRVNELGIAANFMFPGFLRGPEVEKIFSLADLYVMPSVSEPFGISALEAINYETPVILSRQSGASEVLRHVLKVDFWDVDKMADLMVNALLHDELRHDMIAMAREEVKRLRWDASAVRTLDVYKSLL